MRKLLKINCARLRDGAQVRFGAVGVAIAPSAINTGKKSCFVMITFCSAGESTVTDNKFFTISCRAQKFKFFMCNSVSIKVEHTKQ